MGAVGHFLPTLAVVHELSARGEVVHYFIPERYRAHVEAAGAIWHPYGSTILVKDPDRPRRRNIDAVMAEVPCRFAEEMVAATPPLVEELSKQRPDVLVCDTYAFAARLAGEHLGIPVARSNPTYMLSDSLNYYRGPDGGRLLSPPSVLAKYDELMAPLFARHDLPRRSFWDLRTQPAELDIVYVSSAFHPGADQFGERVLFVGPSLRPDVRRFGEPVDVHAAPYGALIYVSLGTVCSYDPAFFYLCMEALGPLNARVVMQVGDHLAPRFAGDLPPNAVARAQVAQLDLLARADLFITHGGMGSTMEALWSGVPMLAIPQSAEQRITAKRLEELGAGLLLEREDISISTLRRGAVTLLNEPSYRRRAQELGEAGRRDGGYLRACDRIQELARTTSSSR
jgi:MGT family glycosyltransferase